MSTFRLALFTSAAVASLAVSSCGSDGGRRNPPANAANAAQQQTVPELAIPVPEPPLGRDQLLLAATRAASDFAVGADDRKRQKDLADKKFEFRIRFGCEGPAGDGRDRPFSWTFNEKNGALKVRASLTLSLEDGPVKAIAGEAFEAVEGFWVRRPWLLSAACPKKALPDGEPPQPPQKTAPDVKATLAKVSEPLSPSFGIAQFFTATDPRTLRRSGRAYEATEKLDEGDVPTGGFDLVLTGRLVALPNGRVIACTFPASGGRPTCVISVEFGKVSLERADTHEQLAQWGAG